MSDIFYFAVYLNKALELNLSFDMPGDARLRFSMRMANLTPFS